MRWVEWRLGQLAFLKLGYVNKWTFEAGSLTERGITNGSF